MIVLDTNVISALMQSTPERKVVAWLDRQAPESIWTTTVNVFEILFGLEVMVKGKRQKGLHESFDQMLRDDLDNRIFDFDVSAAQQAAQIAAKLRATGSPVEIRDIEIAGIVAAHRGTLATRNTKHFVGTGIKIINPWEA
jgi:predicted nucleic acid-binding protein